MPNIMTHLNEETYGKFMAKATELFEKGTIKQNSTYALAQHAIKHFIECENTD